MSVWFSERRNVPPRSTSTIVGADASPWGPYPDERTAVRASADVIDRVRPTWSDEAKEVALAIGWAESRFGLTPDWQMADGSPSYNWGAVVATGSRGTITHADHTADAKPVQYRFAAFATADEGFEFWASRLPAPALAAATTGNARGVAEGMYAACWFSGTCPPSCTDAARIDAYANLIVGAARHVVPFLSDDTADAEPAVQLGQLVGLPLGKCYWHDAYKGGGTSSATSTSSSQGAPSSEPTTASAASGDSGGLLAAIGLGVIAIGLPMVLSR